MTTKAAPGPAAGDADAGLVNSAAVGVAYVAPGDESPPVSAAPAASEPEPEPAAEPTPP